MAEVSWQDVRGLRASPPGRATRGKRKAVFSAGLEQAHQFASAAEEVGYATRPVLLFYALCQAFRAVCAAHLERDWEPVGHGLSAIDRGEVLDTVVSAREGSRGLYQAALSPEPDARPFSGEVTVGEVIASNPELLELEFSPTSVPRPFPVRPAEPLEEGDPDDVLGESLHLLLDGMDWGDSRDEFQEQLGRYDSLTGVKPAESPTGLPTGLFSEEEDRNGIAFRRLTFPSTMFPVARARVEGESRADHIECFHELATGAIAETKDRRWVIPPIGTNNAVVDPLSSWWLILLGLSSAARYRPAAWTKAIDVDRSDNAIALERLLDKATSSLPHYVFAGLTADISDASL